MRIILIGSERDRGRVHAELAAASIGVAGEFETLAAAQAAGIAADGYLIASRNGDASMEDAYPGAADAARNTGSRAPRRRAP
jgi:hypothetical protein